MPYFTPCAAFSSTVLSASLRTFHASLPAAQGHTHAQAQVVTTRTMRAHVSVTDTTRRYLLTRPGQRESPRRCCSRCRHGSRRRRQLAPPRQQRHHLHIAPRASARYGECAFTQRRLTSTLGSTCRPTRVAAQHLSEGHRLRGDRVEVYRLHAQHDTTRHDTTRHDTTRHDTTRHDTTRHDTTRHDTTRHDTRRDDTTYRFQSQHVHAPS
jgi:hypothetical protein